MGVGLDAGGDAHQHVRLGQAAGDERLDAVELVERVDDDAPHSGLQRGCELGFRLVVAVEDDPGGREADALRDVQLAAGGDVEVQAFLLDEFGHGDAEKRLARVGHRVGTEGVAVFAAAEAQLVFAVDVERRAEEVGELLDVAAAE